MLVAHALFKAALFLVVGVVDHATGTRDLRVLSGVGRGLPVTARRGGLAGASMAGVPPFAGLRRPRRRRSAACCTTAACPAAVVVLGAGRRWARLLTAAYRLRVPVGRVRTSSALGTRARRGGTAPAPSHRAAIRVAPAAAPRGTRRAPGARPVPLRRRRAARARTPNACPAERPGSWRCGPACSRHSPLRGPARVVGAARCSSPRRRVERLQAALCRPRPTRTPTATCAQMRRRAVTVVTAAPRSPSAGLAARLPRRDPRSCSVAARRAQGLFTGRAVPGVRASDPPIQALVGAVVSSPPSSPCARQRLSAVLVVGVTGYGVAVLFVLQGAPDLALTQVLVETLTLVVFVLVLRRLPADISDRHRRAQPLAAAGDRAGRRAGDGRRVALVRPAPATTRRVSCDSGAGHRFGGGKNIVNVDPGRHPRLGHDGRDLGARRGRDRRRQPGLPARRTGGIGGRHRPARPRGVAASRPTPDGVAARAPRTTSRTATARPARGQWPRRRRAGRGSAASGGRSSSRWSPGCCSTR